MREQLIAYFSAEKVESGIFAALGLLALLTGAWLLGTRSEFRGAAVPLLAVGAIQIAVGGAVFARTDGQVTALLAKLGEDPAAFGAEEAARMARVMASFKVYKAIEVALFVVGVALTYAFPARPFAYFAGAGLVGEAGLMLVADLFAEHRGGAYLAAVLALGR